MGAKLTLTFAPADCWVNPVMIWINLSAGSSESNAATGVAAGGPVDALVEVVGARGVDKSSTREAEFAEGVRVDRTGARGVAEELAEDKAPERRMWSSVAASTDVFF